MSVIDGEAGAGERTSTELDADVVIVGSGAAGATVAHALAGAGLRVIALEEGPPPRTESSALGALRHLYRDAGALTALGADPMPLLQGRCVGGTTVINGAIQVPLPHDVWASWPPALRALLPWDRLEAARERLDAALSVRPTSPDLLGGAGRLMLDHLPGSTPIRRNAPGCQGSGRCLTGCPTGGKASVDRTLLPLAMAHGAVVIARCRATDVQVRRGRVTGVRARYESGLRLRVHAPRVVLAASAIQSTRLVQRLGVRGAGRGFMAHPGAAMAGLFPQDRFPEGLGQGATQAAEDLGHRARGFKLETLHLRGPFQQVRVPGLGAALADRLAQSDRIAMWGVACRAEARGRILPGPTVLYSLTARDRQVLLQGLAHAAEGMVRAGALEVWPGLHGAPEVIRTVAEARALAGLPPRAGTLPMVATHMFGGIPLGDSLEVGGIRGLYAADSAIFPGNIGVNPMSAIMAVAAVVAEALC